MPGILVLIYASAIMFVMRHFAGPPERYFSELGQMWFCMIPSGIGLYLLSVANTPLTALVAAKLWACRICFMWPALLAATSRRFPHGGSWSIGIVGFVGALAIYFVLP